MCTITCTVKWVKQDFYYNETISAIFIRSRLTKTHCIWYELRDNSITLWWRGLSCPDSWHCLLTKPRRSVCVSIFHCWALVLHAWAWWEFGNMTRACLAVLEKKLPGNFVENSSQGKRLWISMILPYLTGTSAALLQKSNFVSATNVPFILGN